jgi:hypothetical protein
MAIVAAVVVVASLVAVGGLVWWVGRRRPNTKQCPECGAYVGLEEHVCVHCGYRFEGAVA